MPLSGAELASWVAGLFGHILLLAVLLIRHRAVRFPFFTALIAFAVLKTAVLFYVSRHSIESVYVRTYFVMLVVDVSLQFLVVCEVAWHVFRPLGRWAPDVRRGLQVLGCISLAAASALTWLAAPGALRREFAVVIKANFFSSVLLGELFLGMVVLSTTVGLPWRTHVARIAYGLGFYSLIDVLIEAGHTLYGASQSYPAYLLTMTRHVIYLIILGGWIVTLWQDAPEPRELGQEMREQIHKLQLRLAYDRYTIRNWRRP